MHVYQIAIFLFVFVFFLSICFMSVTAILTHKWWIIIVIGTLYYVDILLLTQNYISENIRLEDASESISLEISEYCKYLALQFCKYHVGTRITDS